MPTVTSEHNTLSQRADRLTYSPTTFPRQCKATDREVELVPGREHDGRYWLGNPLDMAPNICLDMDDMDLDGDLRNEMTAALEDFKATTSPDKAASDKDKDEGEGEGKAGKTAKAKAPKVKKAKAKPAGNKTNTTEN